MYASRMSLACLRILGFLLFPTLTACAPQPAVSQPAVKTTRASEHSAPQTSANAEGGRPAQGLANPAAVSCVQRGGTYEVEQTPQGERGICALPDGTRCDAWKLHRGQCPP
ncbi:MAG: hypothetical protein RJA70_322 [Pseudomonadota bacterium]|jgi:putative hemolysin